LAADKKTEVLWERYVIICIPVTSSNDIGPYWWDQSASRSNRQHKDVDSDTASGKSWVWGQQTH